jgi:ABC-type transport system involved in cytochrome bd biosynthesis fused ATPase/permease subunit
LLKAVPLAKAYIKKNVLFQWLSLLCNIVLSALFAALIASLFEYERISMTAALPIFAAAVLARIFFSKAAAKNSYLSSAAVKKSMRVQIYEKLAEIGPGYTQNWSTAEITQLTSEGIEQLETYFASYIPQFFYALLAPLTLFILTLFLDWKSALVLLVCVPLIPVSIVLVQKFAKKLLNKYWGQYTALSDSFLENLQGLTTLKVYQADAMRHEKMNEESEKFRKITMRVLIMQLNSISVMDLVAYGGAALGIICAITSYRSGSVSLFAALLIVLLSAEFFIPMRLLGSYFHIAMNGAAAADKMFAILDYEILQRNLEPAKETNHTICANHMNFSYQPEKQILHDVSFHIPSKGMTAFVGESGSGKSTIANLLAQNISGIQGELQLDGLEIEKIQPAKMSEIVSVLNHDAILFSGTVADNLKMAGENITEEQMWQALEKAGIADFLKNEQGLNTQVKEGGSNFSGGQRQRIAFAQMMLKESPIFILDEATSNIDAQSENQIMAQVHQLKEKQSIVCISHRLKNIVDADWIYVLEKGVIVEEGKHEELLKRNGVYANLYNTQKELEAYVMKGEEE